MTQDTLVSVSERLAELAGGEAPEEAFAGEPRKLLRWLRNLQAVDKSMEEWLCRGSEDEQIAKLQQLGELATLYVQARPTDAQATEAIEDADQAVAAMALAALEYALSRLPAGHPDVARLEGLIKALPQKAGLRATQATQHLLRLVEIGIETASKKAVSEQAPVDRLVEMSQRIAATARQLQSVDTLEAPAREEALELAREILRKLKMAFGDKQFIEGLGPVRTEEKARLSEKLAEMVDMYKNLLFEAAQVTPGIMNDPRVRAANDTVGGFAHAFSLMAAREIPTSEADAAQQISAQAAKMPEQWKHLSGQTASRLMQHMEQGMDKAASEIQLRQEALERKQQAEALYAAASDDLSPGARRYRRARRLAQLTKAAARRNAGDLNGDGILDKYQGLKPEDLALAKQLGDSLRNIGKQVAGTPPIEVKQPVGNKKREPKGFAAQKAAERENQKPTKNPQTPRGPSNGSR